MYPVLFFCVKEPVSIAVKRAKYLVKFVIGFVLTVVLLAMLWMAIGCLEYNFQLDQCESHSWVFTGRRTHAIMDKRKLLVVAYYFVLNLAGAGRGDIVAHNYREAIVIIFCAFIMSFQLAYVQAHVFALVYKLTMKNRVYLQNKMETNKVLNT